MFRDQIEGSDGQKPGESELERRGSALLILAVGVVYIVFHEVASALETIEGRSCLRGSSWGPDLASHGSL